MVCTRTSANLRVLLYKRKAFSVSVPGENKGTSPCGVKRCLPCKLVNPITTVTSTTTSNCYRINCNATCISRCLVYLAECTVCKKQYVGNTTQQLRDRITAGSGRGFCVIRDSTEIERMGNNEGYEGAESLQAAVNYFFYLAKCYWPAVAMEICRRTALKKKWRPQVREKWDAFAFSFAPILILSRKKKRKRLGTRWRKNKMATALIQTVGEAKLFSDT